ncbi:class I adenylate-forming enzyme family protein [Azospirillum doebereinerae]|uniref:class I adenylate-forming enzyme family protein n=1 Tax=Azospirillum doebereinerae TaxID=92933 RepID=UPI001EE58767|nr:AMP-binding protein [Azospirillum doebereinerae]MCG5238323.1 AMP-binding protein [Azospirillum doebereinerae]
MVNIYQTAAFHAQRRPDAAALDDGERRLGFGGLTDLARRQADRLEALGAGRGERVAVVANGSIDYVALYHATALTGFILVPLNTRLTPTELAWALGHADPRVVLHDDANAALVEAARALDTGGREWLTVVALSKEAGPQDEETDDALRRRFGAVEADTPALIVYTSGTTSLPKGAVLTHGNLVWNAVNYQVELGIGEETSALLATPLFHIGGFGVLNGPVLYGGGSLRVVPRFETEAVLRAIGEAQPTHLFLLSAMWVTLTDRPGFAELRFPSVRYVQTAASPLSEQRQAAIRRVFPNAEFGWGFGMTESCVTTIKNRFTAEILAHPGSVGHVWRHVAYRLADEEGRILPDLTGPGELQVKAPTVFAGYWNDPEATAAALTADGWLRTGDLFRFDPDGFAHFIGRSKDMVKTGGENVAALEVENCLVQHPAVSEAAVFGVPHERWGEELRAAVVAAPGKTPDPEELRAFCRARLAGFKVPKAIAVVAGLPRSSSGKVQKFKLTEARP